MSDTVIEIENISKQYRLGSLGTGTFTRDLQSWWAGIRGKEDPNSKIDARSKALSHGQSAPQRDNEYIWALRDVSLEVKRGDVLGIIGSNGAGKSTLLKILSRVTAPSQGEVRIAGRVASLLEVGTGFHPELTGRENIFLNGCILGMSKKEMLRKFDDIVEFSEIQAFVDTPVKRYSSGMYVRLAFAIAAHLDPEILIVDEVLAVGDASFQRKCLGKMSEVSKEGRTVLFVSHNMTAVTTLCSSGIILNDGSVQAKGDAGEMVVLYLQGQRVTSPCLEYSTDDMPGDDRLRLVRCCFMQRGIIASYFDINQESTIEIIFQALKNVENMLVGVNAYNAEGVCLFASMDWRPNKISIGWYSKSVKFPGRLFAEGTVTFLVQLVFYEPDIRSVLIKDAISVEGVDSGNQFAVRGLYKGTWPGVLRLEFAWSDAEKL